MIGVQFVHPKIKGVMDSVPHGTNASSHNTSAHDPWLYESGQEQLAPKIVQACVKRDMLVLSTSWCVFLLRSLLLCSMHFTDSSPLSLFPQL